MKLYTEEQVIQMIEKSRITGLTAEYLILTTNGIELPSDEEIEKVGWDYELNKIGDGYNHHFIEGAKWVRNKILNK